jgi:hypothetical protein
MEVGTTALPAAVELFLFGWVFSGFFPLLLPGSACFVVSSFFLLYFFLLLFLVTVSMGSGMPYASPSFLLIKV